MRKKIAIALCVIMLSLTIAGCRAEIAEIINSATAPTQAQASSESTTESQQTPTNEEDKSSSESNSDIFDQLPEEFVFSSGAGAWRTVIYLNDDGSFDGKYSDSDMGISGDKYPNGTVYLREFKGKFINPKQINEYTYSMELNSPLELIGGNNNEEYIENDIRYVYTDPYGFNDADEFYLYLPGAPLDDLPDEFLSWCFLDKTDKTLPYYGIYNIGGEQGFIGHADEKLENENVDNNENTVISSNVVQEYNGDVYFCSSYGNSAFTLNLLCLDLSYYGYEKIPISDDGGSPAFLIYDDYIYYISGYSNKTFPSYGVVAVGDLYSCDLSGGNKTLISQNVSNLYFYVEDDVLYFNIFDKPVNSNDYKNYLCSLNLNYEISAGVKSIINDNETTGNFRASWLFCYDDDSGQYMEFDGGYYYYSTKRTGLAAGTNVDPANVFYYRKDIESGELRIVGFSYNQTI